MIDLISTLTISADEVKVPFLSLRYLSVFTKGRKKAHVEDAELTHIL